jgi:hypothetical protein
MALKTTVGMFRYIFKAIFTVTFIKAIGTVLEVRTRIYRDSRVVCFLFNCFPLLIQTCKKIQSSNTAPKTTTTSIWNWHCFSGTRSLIEGNS